MLFHLWTMPGVPEIHKRIRIYGQSAANSIKSWGVYEITHSMGYADAKPDTLERSSATFLLRYSHSAISATFETLWLASSLFSNVLRNIQKLRNKEHGKKRKNHKHRSDLKKKLGTNYTKPRVVVDRSFYDKFIYFLRLVRIENSKRSIDNNLNHRLPRSVHRQMSNTHEEQCTNERNISRNTISPSPSRLLFRESTRKQPRSRSPVSSTIIFRRLVPPSFAFIYDYSRRTRAEIAWRTFHSRTNHA